MIGCRHGLVIAVTSEVTPNFCFMGAVTTHGQAQALPVCEIIGCSHRLVIAITGAGTPDPIFNGRSHHPWPSAGTSGT